MQYEGMGSLASGLQELQQEAGVAANTQQAKTAGSQLKLIDPASGEIPRDATTTIHLTGENLQGVKVLPSEDKSIVKIPEESIRTDANGKTLSFDVTLTSAALPGSIHLLISTSTPGVPAETITLTVIEKVSKVPPPK